MKNLEKTGRVGRYGGGGWNIKREQHSWAECVTGQSQVQRTYKYHAQCPWVLRRPLGQKFVNLCSAHGHFGAIISITINSALKGASYSLFIFKSVVEHNWKILN